MMNDDKDIRRMFDEYADGLEPRPDLASKAREKMNSSRRDPARRVNRLRAALIGLASLGGVAACVAVGIYAFNVVSRDLGGSTAPSAPSSPTPMQVTKYDVTDVRAVAVSRDEISKYFDVAALEAQYDVFAENYYACYLKSSGELVYYRGTFGMETEYGATQVGMIAEKAEYRRTDLETEFSALFGASAHPVTEQEYVGGEYISQTYYSPADTHYYVTTMGNEDKAQEIIECIMRN